MYVCTSMCVQPVAPQQLLWLWVLWVQLWWVLLLLLRLQLVQTADACQLACQLATRWSDNLQN